MGAFNSIFLTVAKNDGSHVGEEIQFHWGHKWQHQYRLGDRIRSEEGQQGTITVLGGGRFYDYKIILEDWVIKGVIIISDQKYDELEAKLFGTW